MTVKLIWATPAGDDLVAYMARVSNPDNQDNKATAPKLIKYLIDHKHWSPFEMVNACVEITTVRDITRQITRHRSFTFQEFSGRYSAYDGLELERECRTQDPKNRQASLPCDNPDLVEHFRASIEEVAKKALGAYNSLLRAGVAKEVARAVLPEGLVPATMYMNGTLRSWIHYWAARCTPETQKEHRLIAEQTREIVLASFPQIAETLNG